MKQSPLLMNSGSRLVWIGLMERLDHVGCIREVFRWFQTGGIGGVVESFLLDKVQQPWPLATAINSAVQDRMNLPLVRVIQFDRRWWIDCPVGDLTRAS